MAGLIDGITDDMLDRPTPCSAYRLGDILDHCVGLTHAFTAAARKEPLGAGADGPPPPGRLANLAPDWRTRLPAQLDTLAAAWREAGATEGMADAGGVTLPAEIMHLVALNEVFIHGWDLAASSNQTYDADETSLATVHEFLAASAAENPDGTPGLFGPPLAVPDTAPPLARTIALSGRDPFFAP